MIGAGADEHSYVVGVGSNAPLMVQHRRSSCPAPTEDAAASAANGGLPTCDWSSGFFPSLPNPRLDLIKGALVAGPTIGDQLEARRAADGNRVSMADNAGFIGALAGLRATETNVRSCEALNGVWIRYTGTQSLV
jgi:hypothetical protein